MGNAYLFNKSEDKVYRLGLKDNVHRISDLDNDSMLPLYHNCRCTVTAVWETKGEPPENLIVTSLTEDNNFNIYFMGPDK